MLKTGFSTYETCGKMLKNVLQSFSAVANTDLQRPKPWMAPQQPPSLSESLKEWWTGHHPWHEAGKSRSHASTLSSGTVYKGLTYISRVLRLLSLSMEGINPHEGERHIQALVTGWHLAEDWTPRPCPPDYICHRAIIFLILHDPCIKQRQSQRQVYKWSLNHVVWW